MASTGTFSINGTEIECPTEHGWIERSNLGDSGDGHSVYPAVRQYQLRWNLMSPDNYYEIQTFYNAVGSTGTVVVGLPQYGAATYEFYNYSGCVLAEPYHRGFFSENYIDVVLLVKKIRV